MGKMHGLCKENVDYLRVMFGDDYVDGFLYFLNNPTMEVNSERKDVFENIKAVAEQMERAGENHWWLSKDKRVLAYHQLKNDRLMVPFGEFHEALEVLLDRPIWTHEFALNYEMLVKEAEEAFGADA